MEKMQRIVCLCGYKRSGKDYVANLLRENHGYRHMQIAHRLKETLRVMFGFNDDQLHGAFKETVDPVWKITPRRAMEFMGTEIGQYDMQKFIPGIGRNFWIRSLIQDPGLSSASSVVISDLRFAHEIDELKRAFPNRAVCVVRIENPMVGLNSTHPSETTVDRLTVDLVFRNDKTVYAETAEDVARLEREILSKIKSSP
jgi:hypothetical protein